MLEAIASHQSFSLAHLLESANLQNNTIKIILQATLMQWFRVFCIAFIFLMFVGRATACVVCVPVPKETTADVLLASKAVAFAREDPQEPYTYQVLEILKGRADNAPIGLLVDSVTRRRLAVDRQSNVVLVRRRGGSSWDTMGFANPAYQAFVRTVLSNAAHWQRRNGRDRLNYFETLLTSDHDALRKQAVLEISRGSYRRIRTSAGRVSRQDIYRVLRDPTWLEWAPLYIVMLGQSELAEDKTYIVKRFKNNARYGLERNLAAWTTAFVEMQRSRAIDNIATTYFGDTSYKQAALIEMQKAFSVLGSEYPKELRSSIISAYRTLIHAHPWMAGFVARDAAAWRNWSLAPQIANLAASALDGKPSSEYIVSYYLSLARDATSR